MLSKKMVDLKWWEVGILTLAIGFASSYSIITKGRRRSTKVYTRQLKQALWAPPAWVFGPAWTINNFFLLLALQQILQLPAKQKRPLIILQAGIWVIFFSFNYVYFKRKSPVLAALWTLTDAALANASIITLGKQDKNLIPYYLPFAAWTNFASSVAIYQALENRDPVFKIEPGTTLKKINLIHPASPIM